MQNDSYQIELSTPYSCILVDHQPAQQLLALCAVSGFTIAIVGASCLIYGYELFRHKPTVTVKVCQRSCQAGNRSCQRRRHIIGWLSVGRPDIRHHLFDRGWLQLSECAMIECPGSES